MGQTVSLILQKFANYTKELAYEFLDGVYALWVIAQHFHLCSWRERQGMKILQCFRYKVGGGAV